MAGRGIRLVDNKTVLTKTAKGVDEIDSRFYKLPSRLRSILIIIDGTATVEALVAKAVALGGDEKSLAELMQKGFVRDARNAAAPPTCHRALSLPDHPQTNALRS
ncbi:MAG: hypothetical protein H0V78_13240 [Burkholderiales bacterium]|nr:hypothetical protein [Burkholderiales bacterium]